MKEGYCECMRSHVLENEVVEPSIVNLAGFGKTSGTRRVDAAHLVYHKQNIYQIISQQ